MKRIFIFMITSTFLLLTCRLTGYAQQSGYISGVVIDKINQVSIGGAKVTISIGNKSAADTTLTSDSIGYFSVRLPIGKFNIRIESGGYEALYRYDVEASSGYEKHYVFEMERTKEKTLDEVQVSTVRTTARAASLQTPLSVQRLTSEEILNLPGGNYDLSRVAQSLPGVTSTAGSAGGYRNDIIIRGGSPSENVYYLDGIEVPVINHFNTQGGAGGVEGILNVYFIEDLTVNSSAFDAKYDNVLSSVFQIKQRKGNLSRLQGNVRSSLIETQVTVDGPIGKSKKLSYIASARSTYLGLLFDFLDLPLRPNFIDYQLKVSYQINKKTLLTAIGFGAVDRFRFVNPRKDDVRKNYLRNSLPLIFQYSYTAGVSLRRSLENGYFDVSLSINSLHNEVTKKNTLMPGRENEIVSNFLSDEKEIKLRSNVNQQINGWSIGYGITAQAPILNSSYFDRRFVYSSDGQGGYTETNKDVNFNANASFLRYGLYVEAGRKFFDNKLGVNLGARADGNTFTETGNELQRTLSPRISLSYSFHPKWKVNLTSGIYYKLLPFNTLTFKDTLNSFANKKSDYIRSTHVAFGFEYLHSLITRFTLEGFFKKYDHTPISIRNGVSLYNIGIDYGVIGNEAVATSGEGYAYGLEFFAQQKLLKNFFFIFSYTFSRSLYSGFGDKFAPASWDNRHVISFSALVLLPKNWSVGVRLQYQGSAPYTPFDLEASRAQYLSTGKGVLDYSKTNEERLRPYHNGDIRVDKKWYFKRNTLNVYFLVSNFYFARTASYPYYGFERDDRGQYLTTDNLPIKPDGSNASPIPIIYNDLVTVVPVLGLIFEFR